MKNEKLIKLNTYPGFKFKVITLVDPDPDPLG